MPKRIHLISYLTDHELHERYCHAQNPVERSRWHFLWLLARGLTATAIARVTGYSAYHATSPDRAMGIAVSARLCHDWEQVPGVLIGTLPQLVPAH